ncbi:hypothetical protein [Methanoregula sp.]|uniref:hypothetical protein n=1 Tax=Methanoregula sp. TaxID=2052170 RepID=UPI002B8F9990|nr:hypothetical protein [Methanoregula sp.]HVP96617.1 hypothetical protein [Methanoregula sp.]
MQTNPNNPYDEVFGNLSRIVEEIVRNMPEAEHARVIGYTIVTRHVPGEPGIFVDGADNSDDDIPYEVLESDTHIFITAAIPPDAEHAPYADIQPQEVRICVDDSTTTIDLEKPIDIIHSTYRVHRGVMDITLRKVPDYL